MQIAVASLLLDDSVDNMLDTSKVDLSLQKRLDVRVFTHHLKQVNAHALLLLREICENCEHFAKVTHIDTALMEQVFERL